ncbi:BTB/POZ domain with WD40/YVTN repeat-like protein [Striga asiatica]|uniref:BTB/POZ domain with WD40/YVTN repeat-like protein n=1 Tax=Striga asiatica TaxID=4170 RepID=A0A5A7P5U4_STRAF|nr:BTB/POZ domain with WD40/YVTN repeat-like protein [Striga asiatica]
MSTTPSPAAAGSCLTSSTTAAASSSHLRRFSHEEGHDHDPPHPAPLVPVLRENHVLPTAREYIKHDVARWGAQLGALAQEDSGGEVAGGDGHYVELAHADEEEVAVGLGESGQGKVVEFVADLEPAAEDRERRGVGREVEAAAAEEFGGEKGGGRRPPGGG